MLANLLRYGSCSCRVKSLIDEAYNDAQKLLIEHRDKLDIIAQTLLEKEKINEQEFKRIFE